MVSLLAASQLHKAETDTASREPGKPKRIDSIHCRSLVSLFDKAKATEFALRAKSRPDAGPEAYFYTPRTAIGLRRRQNAEDQAFTTIFTSLLGTVMIFTISLPSVRAVMRASLRASFSISAAANPAGTTILERIFPLI